MNGVDKCDQFLALYSFCCKTEMVKEILCENVMVIFFKIPEFDANIKVTNFTE